MVEQTKYTGVRTTLGVEERRRDLTDQEPSASSCRTTCRRQAILVVGMHRSGTSALTGVLVSLGAATPRTPIKPNASNPKGFWESEVLMRFHDRLLASSGSHWADWRRFNPDWAALPAISDFADELRGLIKQEFGNARQFVIKDPRICRLLPFWLDQLQDLDIEPRVVLSLRNPLEVAKSLEARDGISPRTSLLLWLRHMLDAEAETRHLPRSVVGYGELITDWRGVVDRLTRELGFNWVRRSAKVEREIDAFLTSGLRHHQVTDYQLAECRDVFEWVKTAYTILGWTTFGKADSAAWVRLDEIRHVFDDGSAVFGPLLYETSEAARVQLDKRTRELKAELAAHADKVNVLSAKLASQKAHTGYLETQLSECAAKSQTLSRQLKAQEAHARAHAKELAKLKGDCNRLKQSTSWRITAPLRLLKRSLRWMGRAIRGVR